MVEPVLPSFRLRPQGGDTAPIDQRAVFTAIVYVLISGCAWRYLPPTFGVSPATAHRRFSAWTASGVWRRLHRVVLDEIGARGGLDWSSVIIDAASVRAKKKGPLTGPNPVVRGKAGSKLHVLTDAQGLPVVVGVSAANVNDVQALRPLILGIPAVRSRRGPVADTPIRFAPTRRTTPPATWRGYANATSLHGSPGRAWSPPNDSGDTDGRSRGRFPGSSDTAA